MRKQKEQSLPVSQRDLAAYLGISGTLLSMTKTGRHGTRGLGAVPSKKMADLLLAHHQSQKSDTYSPSLKKMHDRSASDCARLAKVILVDADYADAHVVILRARLDKMTGIEQQSRHWMNTVDLLLATLPKTKESEKDRIWLENQQQIILEKLQKNGLPAQVKLEVQIEMEKAKARTYREALKKLLKK